MQAESPRMRAGALLQKEAVGKIESLAYFFLNEMNVKKRKNE
jgi:hypothetical protein